MLNKKKLVAMLLTVCLLILTLTGCAGSGVKEPSEPAGTATASPITAPDSTGNGEEDEEPADEFDEHLEIKWICYNQFDNPVPEGTEIQKLIEEKFNVTLTIPNFDIHNSEQLNLFWAEGNTADRIQTNSGTQYRKLVDQGLLRPITEEMAFEYAPTWMEIVYEMVDPEIIRAQMTYKGEFWGLPYTNATQSKQGGVMAIREDWMENLGITETPKTIEEFEDLLRRFTYDDPDGNGQDDTYGLHGTNYGFTYVYGAFGVTRNAWYERDGKVVFSNTTEEFKELLKTLQRWCAEGYMDPEFVTDDRATQRSKWADGKFGVLGDHPWWFDVNTPDNVTNLILDKDENAKLKFIEPFTGPDGKSGTQIGFPQIMGNAVYFGKDASDEKVKRIMAIEESFCTDEEWFKRCHYGIEGEHYTVDEDGVIIPNDELLTAQTISELGLRQSFALKPGNVEGFLKDTLKVSRPPYEMAMNINHVYTGVAFVTSEPNEVANTKGADITTIADEFFFDAITGRIDIDAEWDAFLKRLDDAGLQEIIEEYERLLVK